MFSIMFIHVLFVRKVRAISSGNSINLDSTANIELLSYYVPKSFGNLRFYRIMWNMGLSSPAIGGPTLGSSDCCVATPAAVLTPFLRHGTRPLLWLLRGFGGDVYLASQVANGITRRKAQCQSAVPLVF